MSGTKRAKTGPREVELAPVRGRGDWRRFVGLPYTLYRGDPNWVAPLRIAQKDILDRKRHPFYKTSDVEMFLARRGGRVVGRVMAILNRAHNDFHGERTGFFGFFEVERDYEAAAALLDAAREWLGSRGAEVMRGPVNPSTNYELGLLVEGFDSPPAVMMTYNPPYYAEFLERYGLEKAMDLYAYFLATDSVGTSAKLKRVADRLKASNNFTVRSVDMKNLKSEVDIMRRVYNDAWSRNWGFVPVTEGEFERLARDLKQIVDPRIVMIAEQKVEGEDAPRPIGFFLAVPDINRALKKINGRLLPFGLLKLWWHSRKIRFVRVITMGTVREHQNLGMAALFYDEMYRRSKQIGYPSGEVSWVLESNVLMNRAAEMLGAHKTKTYRIYEMPIPPRPSGSSA